MSEFRQDPITGRWRLVAEGRSARPNEYAAPAPAASSETDCPFCEGHEARTPPEVDAVRPAGGTANAPGWLARSIPNRFPSVAPAPPPVAPVSAPLLARAPGSGFHEVIIESPSHSPDLAYLPEAHLRRLFRFFQARVRARTAPPSVGTALLFENRGPESGGTLPHPHAQLVATEVVPFRLEEEREGFRRALRAPGGGCLLESVVLAETEAAARIVSEDPRFVAFAPFASEHPYEVWLVPRQHRTSFADASEEEVDRLAVLLPAVLRALDGVRPNASYNWFVHGLASAPDTADEYHWHLEVAPRLVRADGYELGAGTSVNPVPPESAATELREQLEATRTPGPQKR
jgi:UDPglucose--hexose-1-phosphate uridylyltransferase